MKNVFLITLGLVVGLCAGYMYADKLTDAELRAVQHVAREVYERKLADPHHCISICQEQFEKMGC